MSPTPEQANFLWSKFIWACHVAKIAHNVLNDRRYTGAMAARDLARLARNIDPDLPSSILGDAASYVTAIPAPVSSSVEAPGNG